jgi:hypothetical protein
LNKWRISNSNSDTFICNVPTKYQLSYARKASNFYWVKCG